MNFVEITENWLLVGSVGLLAAGLIAIAVVKFVKFIDEPFDFDDLDSY